MLELRRKTLRWTHRRINQAIRIGDSAIGLFEEGDSTNSIKTNSAFVTADIG